VPSGQRHPGLHLGLAYGVGVLVAAQSRITGELSQLLGGSTAAGLLAAAVSFGTGLVVLLLVVLPAGAARSAARRLPAAVRDGRLAWWMLLGGLGGASLVACQGLAVPTLGVALFTVAVVAGQTASSLAVDAVGLGPGGVRTVTPTRVLAAATATAAVGLAVSGRVSAGTLSVGLVALVAVAGGLTAAQQAVNGRVAVATGEPLVAALVNFTVGTTALVVAFAVSAGGSRPNPGDLPPPWDRPLLWLAGPIGVLFIVTAAVVVRTLGVLLFGLLAVAGTLTGSLVLDVVLPTPGTEVTWRVVAGVLLTGVAVAVAAVLPVRGSGP
jgi:transporter family-2 protein